MVVELKRGRTPRDTLAQALEYASFVEPLGYDGLEAILRKYTGEESAVLSEAHAAEFEVGEAVAFNKIQHVVIVGSDITPEIRQTSAFLRKRGIDVTCVEFGFFKTASGEQLMSSDVVVGGDPVGLLHRTLRPCPRPRRTSSWRRAMMPGAGSSRRCWRTRSRGGCPYTGARGASP